MLEASFLHFMNFGFTFKWNNRIPSVLYELKILIENNFAFFFDEQMNHIQNTKLFCNFKSFIIYFIVLLYFQRNDEIKNINSRDT